MCHKTWLIWPLKYPHIVFTRLILTVLRLAREWGTGAGLAVRDLDGADHEDLALIAAPAAASQGIVLAAADNLGFVDLNEPGKAAAVAGHHAASQFSTQQPGR